MAITFDSVLNVAVKESKKLEALTASQRQFALNMAAKIAQAEQFGDLTDEAQTYLAAHIAIQMQTRAAGEGSISGESMGEISRSVTMSVNNPRPDQRLLSTQYGGQFYELREMMRVFNL